jgi:hypothetical protein
MLPECSLNALGETRGVDHAVDRPILEGDQLTVVDEAAAVLVGEVTAPPARTFTDAPHHSSAFGAR